MATSTEFRVAGATKLEHPHHNTTSINHLNSSNNNHKSHHRKHQQYQKTYRSMGGEFLLVFALIFLSSSGSVAGQRFEPPFYHQYPGPGFEENGYSPLVAHQRAARFPHGPPMAQFEARPRMRRFESQPDVSLTIMPYEGYELNGTDPKVSYVIDNKRFVEAVQSRCWATTDLEDPMLVEPTFVIIRSNSEVRVNATAPIPLIRAAGFDPSRSTKILIHGFTQSYPSSAWLRRSRALFEKHMVVATQNLIIMDWGAASQGSYTQVAGVASGMGSFLANFVMKLLEMGTDRNRIHIIGHSLGAHIAGFAGKRIKPKIGRITALDPAGPCFGKIFSNGPQDRLEANDAYEVDVYHYDDAFLGLPGQHGHFDIYVNGGSSQPGCADNMNAMLQALITVILRRDRVLSESHTRSTEVSTCELAAVNCQQVAYECRDYAAFTSGECGRCDNFNSQCFLMGFEHQYIGMGEAPLRNSHPGKRLYIRTGASEMYCLQHYQILVKFEPTPEMALAAKRHKWRLHLDLSTDRGERLNISLTNQMAPNVFSYLLLTEAQPFRFTGAQLQVRGTDGSTVPLQPSSQWPSHKPAQSAGGKSAPLFWPFALEINFMSNIDPDVRRVLSSRLCPVTTGANQIAGSSSSSEFLGASQAMNHQWLQFDECLAPSLGRRRRRRR